MLGMVRDWFAVRRAEQHVRLQAAKVAEGLLNFGDQAPYVDTDTLKWYEGEIGLSSERRVNLGDARRCSRALCRTNAHARNILTQIGNFTVGRGFGVKLQDKGLARRWTPIEQATHFRQRCRELVRRVPRDGEAFLRFFGGETMRFVEPEYVANPPNVAPGARILQGIECDPDDVETVLAYHVALPGLPSERIDAADIVHVRDPYSDANQVRGWPIIYDARSELTAYTEWVEYRAKLNKIRAAFAFIRRHKGATRAQVQSLLDRVKDGSITRSGGTSAGWVQSLPGIGLDTDDRTEYEFPRANIDAGNAADDGRAMRLLIACAFSLPEYLVTGDASNANFASTLVAENPGVRAMQSWQEYFGEHFTVIIARLLDVPTAELKLDYVWPEMVMRDRLKDTQANEILYNAGTLSLATWQQREGLDPAQEASSTANADITANV